MAMAYTTSLRLDDAVGWQLDAIAKADGISINDIFRVAVAEYIERRRQDPDFQVRLRRAVGRMGSMLSEPPAIEQAPQDSDTADAQ
jgi:predicted DNA-binding ribbon-helix-helix protein